MDCANVGVVVSIIKAGGAEEKGGRDLEGREVV
jgi:hypothetical protein